MELDILKITHQKIPTTKARLQIGALDHIVINSQKTFEQSYKIVKIQPQWKQNHIMSTLVR